MPMLALGLLVPNGRSAWVGGLRNRPATVAVLLVTLAFFLAAGFFQVKWG